MQAFKFRLARVLDWYGKRCRLEEDRLRVIFADISRTEAAIRNIRESRKAVERNLVEAKSVLVADLIALQGYKERSRREELAQEKIRGRLEIAVQEVRARVRELRTKIRLLEKLRERRLEEYTIAFDRELQELAEDAFRAASFRERTPHA
jgi:flagellar biosynthesis chaperone FliJ